MASSRSGKKNLCRRRQGTNTSFNHNVLDCFLVIMALLPLSRGMLMQSTRICRHDGYYRFATSSSLGFGVAPTADNNRPTPSSPSSASSLQQQQQDEKPPILQQAIQPCTRLFDLQLPEGRCLGLQLDAASQLSDDAINTWIATNCLHPTEVEYSKTLPSNHTQQTFLLGRLAMRQVLLGNCREIAILKDAHGRPHVPPNYVGSISHKKCRETDVTTGVALLSPCMEGVTMGVGVDIELATTERSSIAKRVLTQHEIASLGRLNGVSSDEEVLLRFSLKEAFYKAIHPLICQYVGFQEAEVIPHDDGTASVEWNLKSGAHTQFDQVAGHWRRINDDFFLSSARVSLKGNRPDECQVGEEQ